MRYELRDYQRDAALEVLKRIRRGRRDWREDGERSSFALSAITGSGKTVIATAVIEALLFGSTDLDTDADPRISFLWITDDPALNRQTRGRMFDASELLAPTTLVEVDESFLDADLAPGRVFFLNTQKLSRSSRLVQSGTNAREFSFWDILRNTIRGDKTDLVLVLDEAHRGMKRAADRKTIVSRLIHGEPGSNPAIPIVLGISATIERFTTAMGEVTDRTGYPNVAVDIERVRASGLIKDEIGLDQPAEKGTFSTTLLREAVKATLSFEQRWAAYSASEGEPEVLPVLVVQVPDKASDAKLTEFVGTIEAEWPGLGPRAIAHVLGEHERLTLGARTVDWVYPESIQTDTDVRVVLAKEAISTGWDCPRAEVLYSERPAKDATHIAQIIGRMVRQPLAHRIATDDALNSVTCYLPLFDQKALTSIKDELEGKGADNGQNRVGATVVRAPMVFERNALLDPAVFAFIEGLPSIPTPDRTASPLRRARTLARLLADDAGGAPLLADAGADLTKRLDLRLDGLAAEHAAEVEDNVQDLLTTAVARTRITTVGEDLGVGPVVVEVATHARDVARDAQRIIDSVREGVGKAWFAHRLAAEPGADRDAVRVRCAALLRVETVRTMIEAIATDWVREQLDRFRVQILNTVGATRDAYTRVQEQTTVPETVTVQLRQNERAATKDRNGDDLPRYGSHVFADAAGVYPADLNDWERTVVASELARDGVVAWYRNPGTATPASLRIAYQNDAEEWASLQPDFIVVSRRTDGTLGASIVDPHGDYLADARAKLHALAAFAERFGDRFVRIESVARVEDGSLRVLDLADPAVRAEVLAFQGGKVTALYQSEHSRPYP
ncbi:MAG: DEAD/DEAH box helicase family protein [Chloroflexi bacterium]|nr:DEAD/DEAH box helicase family protein [Chloroflexota bacterium]